MSNPFDTNPFTNSSASVPVEYDPFDNIKSSSAANISAKTGAQSSSESISQNNTNAYSTNAYSTSTYGDQGGNRSSQMNLDNREALLNQKEQDLIKRERAIEEKFSKLGVEKNWPSKCYPLAYHDISKEIPAEHRSLVRRLYADVLFTWLCLLWNWVVMMGVWFTDGSASSGALWSTLYFVIGVPGSWKLWYRPLYNGIRKNSSGQWVMFFINYLAHLCFSIVVALGVPSTSTGGLMFMLKLLANGQNACGTLAAANTISWTLNLLMGILIIKQAHSTWRSTGVDKKFEKEGANVVIAPMGAALLLAAAQDNENEA